MSAVLVLTLFHVLISLVAVVAGVVLIRRLIENGDDRILAQWFLVTIAVTLVTGFLFPFNGITPAINVGILCTVILMVTLYARYRGRLAGFWRPVYVAGVTLLMFFNTLVLIIQSFQKIGPLHALAPLGNEPAILACQVILLLVSLAAGIFAVWRFRPSLSVPGATFPSA
ncbi:hypothetical protein [Rhizobium oryzicola]|uniref:DUF2306 domain-containing protein n=1 Tax=Rhizobium oryzicola TaxID=1232668 RepID=A0ABT8SX47_9HYPH|nr:hypothetical protein [Rhizobium oryzicola]MDO1582754.1 hypothetical protein [Rhizobium oryzicola]